jgi:hypothetical protein
VAYNGINGFAWMVEMKSFLSAAALIAAVAFAGAASAGNGHGKGPGNANSNSNGGVTVVDAPCTLVLDGIGCTFSGNINGTNKLLETENAYNAQAGVPDIELTDLLYGEYSAPDGSSLHSGTITAPFLVSYYAVKGGSNFMLYQITPTYTFHWDTDDIYNGGGNHPGLSHVSFLGSAGPAAVPEPATWAMMLLGFGGMGALLRRSRRRTGSALA